MRSYILVKIQTGKEESFFEKVKEVKNIVQVDEVFGEYDAVLIFEGELKQMDEAIVQIRKIPYVRTTQTLTSLAKR
jgi:tRNA(Ser,Leu) C12 N-acetylase TAN1